MLDPALTAAVSAATAAEGKPAAAAARLNAWLKRLAEGEVGKDEHTQFLQSVRAAINAESDHAR